MQQPKDVRSGGRREAPGPRTAAALPVVQYLFQDQFTTNINVAFASYLMALLPTLIAFLIAQRWVVSGIMRGSIK